MISSRSEDAHRQEAFERGAAEYVSKPYDENALIKTINDLCLIKI
jgi:PleD family two-component response regulator